GAWMGSGPPGRTSSRGPRPCSPTAPVSFAGRSGGPGPPCPGLEPSRPRTTWIVPRSWVAWSGFRPDLGGARTRSTRPDGGDGVGYSGRMDFGKVMVVFAHPDDAEFGSGGTVATWAKAGSEVTYVCVTDGSAGSN